MRMRPVALLAAAATLALSGCVFTLGGEAGYLWQSQQPPATGQSAQPAPVPVAAPSADAPGAPAAAQPGPLDAERCPGALIDAYVAEMTGFPGIDSDSAGARDADHPVPVPLGGAAVHCATTIDLYDGQSVHTVLVLVGADVPERVRGASGSDIVFDDLNSPQPWLSAQASDAMSGIELFPIEPDSVAALELDTDEPIWIMEAWWLRAF